MSEPAAAPEQPSTITEQDLFTDLALQTSRIAWSELQRFFAAGKVLLLGPDYDLIEVAQKVVKDDVTFIGELQKRGDIAGVSDEQAKVWLADKADLWCVVVRPFVFIQEIQPGRE